MRPELEIVVAVSLDGRISTADRRPWRWSDPADHDWLLSRLAAADLLVIGAGTIRSENPTTLLPEPWVRRRLDAGRSPQPVRLVLTPSLSIAPDARIVTADAPLVIAARAEELEQRGEDFRERAELVPWSDDLGALLDDVARRHDARHVVGLGGGRTNGALLEADRVDTISLTVSSFVVGDAGAPGPFDGHGFGPEAFPQFALEETVPVGRDLVLRYRRDREAPPRGASAGLA